MKYKLTIDYAKVAGNLTNFPVFVNLNDVKSGITLAEARSIRVYKEDGTTELAREIVSKDEMHFKADSLSSIEDTIFIIDIDGVRGDYDATDTYGREAVWSNGYVSVYHLEDDPSGTAPQMTDSKGDYHGTALGGLSTSNQRTGIMGKGLEFFGSQQIQGSSAPPEISGALPRTTSAWAKDKSGANRVIRTFGANSHGALWEMMQYNGDLIWHGYGGGMDTLSTDAPLTSNEWHYVAITYDGATIKVWVEGQFKGALNVTINTAQSINMISGGGYFPPWVGELDEIRDSSVDRSAEWMATEYNNQKEPTTFYTIIEEIVGGRFLKQESGRFIKQNNGKLIKI